MIKIRQGNLSIRELFLNMRETLLHARKYSETSRLIELKSALSIIQGAANERGDRKAARLAIDMQSAIDNWLQREDKTSYVPSVETIDAAFSQPDD